LNEGASLNFRVIFIDSFLDQKFRPYAHVAKRRKMASTGDINIVLGQGSAIKEVHNVRKQSLELSQQFVAQRTEVKKKEEKKRYKNSRRITK